MDFDGCQHEWGLVELASHTEPGGMFPRLDPVSRCLRCGALLYEASRPDSSRPA